ncbi:hypothetical protein [Roseovarius indicus]|uniref:hypothetical protein n=1 Tax=Roseovarius indicus TaxID=540747 RepID=UPI0032ED1E8A
MRTADIIQRAIAEADESCVYASDAQLSPTLCAALKADGLQDDADGIFWLDGLAASMNVYLPGTEAVIECGGRTFWEGDVCQGAHERLALEMKMKHFVNKSALDLLPSDYFHCIRQQRTPSPPPDPADNLERQTND